jgi:hypothetical protein
MVKKNQKPPIGVFGDSATFGDYLAILAIRWTHVVSRSGKYVSSVAWLKNGTRHGL